MTLKWVGGSLREIEKWMLSLSTLFLIDGEFVGACVRTSGGSAFNGGLKT